MKTPREIIAGSFVGLYSWGDHRADVFAEAAIAALTASGYRVVPDWQPIETAPESDWFLFWIPGAEVPGVGKLRKTRKPRKEFVVVTLDDTIGFPTHWMPLPPAIRTMGGGE